MIKVYLLLVAIIVGQNAPATAVREIPGETKEAAIAECYRQAQEILVKNASKVGEHIASMSASCVLRSIGEPT